MQAAQGDPAREALTQSRAARQAGDSVAALRHIEAAIALSGTETPPLFEIEHANILHDLGRKAEALERLAALVRAHPGDPAAHRRLAWLSHQAGDHSTALHYQERAIALTKGETHVSMRIIHANILHALGHTDDAKKELHALVEAHPEDPAPRRRLSWNARLAGDLQAALAHVRTARTLVPQDHGLLEQELSLLIDLGDLDAAAGAIDRLDRPDQPLPTAMLLKRADIALRRGDVKTAVTVAAQACAQEPDNAGAHIVHARALAAADNPAPGVQVLEAFLEHAESTPAVLVHLISLCRKAGMSNREHTILWRAVDEFPAHPVLLRHLFMVYLKVADPSDVEVVLERLQNRLETPVLQRLKVTFLLHNSRYAEAKAVLYPRPNARRSPEEATMLADTLIGTHQYDVALRYLRACLRRWPEKDGFLVRIATTSLRLGRFDRLGADLTAHEGRHPDLDQEILHQRYALALHRGDLDAAVRLSDRILSRGRPLRGDPEELLRLAVYKLPSAQAKHVIKRIEESSPRARWPHASASLNGYLKVEYLLEHDADDSKDLSALQAKVKEHPTSTPRALRLISGWTTQAEPPSTSANAQPIPPVIMQYWDSAEPPPQVAALMQSWIDQSGFLHRLYDRASAREFLRTQMGPRWLQAFMMANNTAEGADLLRLCLLAKNGGIWVDADDLLYGSLTRLVHGRCGLLIYREAFGGAIGNNFIAASPEHPVIIRAAQLARAALLQRSAETSWLKTGPGLLSRAVAQYIATAPSETVRAQMTILDYATVADEISMHNTLAYKTTKAHWNHANSPISDIWSWLVNRLQEA